MIVFIFNIIIFFILFILLILISVAFYTLIERKIIRINQLRLGPNKLIFIGFLQPVVDGFKLFLKILNNPKKNNLFFYLSPFLSFSIIFFFWFLIFINNIFFKNIIFLFIFGISVYSFVLGGWSRFSKFGYLGGLRASSQTISYEVRFAIIIIFIIYLFKNYNILNFNEIFLFIFLTPIIFLWILTILIETNRAPFDFSEGERELISGFNVEYGTASFTLFFLAEYSIIIFLRIFSCLLFSLSIPFLFFYLFIFISMRTSFPRFRYDYLLSLLWFKVLPFIILLIIIIIYI